MLILVGSFCDLHAEEKISEFEAQTFADSVGIPLFIISSKDNINIDKLLNYLGNKLIELNNNYHLKNTKGLYTISRTPKIEKKKRNCIK